MSYNTYYLAVVDVRVLQTWCTRIINLQFELHQTIGDYRHGSVQLLSHLHDLTRYKIAMLDTQILPSSLFIIFCSDSLSHVRKSTWTTRKTLTQRKFQMFQMCSFQMIGGIAGIAGHSSFSSHGRRPSLLGEWLSRCLLVPYWDWNGASQIEEQVFVPWAWCPWVLVSLPLDPSMRLKLEPKLGIHLGLQLRCPLG